MPPARDPNANGDDDADTQKQFWQEKQVGWINHEFKVMSATALMP